jgi:hypothetical protein
MFPAYQAYLALLPYVSAGRSRQWRAYLSSILPNETYVNLEGNWGLVAVGGEFDRTVLGGFGSPTWWEDLLQWQLDQGKFTPNGECTPM